jgi:F420-dependent oxidoreductase-like protein
MSRRISFGIYVHSGWRGEFAHLEDPREHWAAMRAYALEAERLGFDAIWVGDHLQNVPEPRNESLFEVWTALAGLSQCTSTIRLGQIVTCSLFRNPAYLAKVAANVDVMSGGRVEFGIGAGWNAAEYLAYGYGETWPGARERIERMGETLEIVTRMWSAEPTATFTGVHCSVSGAQCDPKPLQRPRPPILVAGQGERYTIPLVARFADKANFTGSLEVFEAKSKVLEQECESVGREFGEITRTFSGEVFIREAEREILEHGSRSYRRFSVEDWMSRGFIGTPSMVSEKLRRLVDAGAQGFILASSEMPDFRTMRLLAEQVIPAFRK